MAYVNVKEASKRLNISLRAIQRRCKKLGLKKDANGYLIPEETYRKWLLNDTPATHQTTPVATPTTNDTTTAPLDEDDGKILIEYTDEEWVNAQIIFKNYPVLKERTHQQEIRIEDHKETIRTLQDNLKLANHRLEKLLDSMGDQTKSILQRNTIEWIDKSKPEK